MKKLILIILMLFGLIVYLSSFGMWASDRNNNKQELPLFGFTSFPYDFTGEAINRTRQLVLENATIYALHLDDGIPWKEALSDAPFPVKIQKDWEDWDRGIPSDFPVYVGLAPLGKDRKTLVTPSGGETMPKELVGARLDDPKVIQAYTVYARRIIKQFHPRYLNLGIEAGELAARDPERWSQFESLFKNVRMALKREFPSVQIGISFGLQSLKEKRVAVMVKSLIEQSDYIGISFYPYASNFGEKFGLSPLPQGNAAWRETLVWLKGYSDALGKPIAICETGYTTKDISLPKYSLEMHGDNTLQAAYIKDLIDIAKRDQYLFVVWFLVVDYDKLYAKMPSGSEVNLLWRNIGLFDGDLRPKPALDIWKSAFTNTRNSTSSSISNSELTLSGSNIVPPSSGGVQIGFKRPGDLFTCAPPGKATIDESGPRTGVTSMRWDFKYRAKEWQWCIKELKPGQLAGMKHIRFWTRSSKTGPIFLQIEEKNGEAYFAILSVQQDWSAVSLDINSLSVDESKKKDGHLDIGQVTKILLADSAAIDGATGEKSIWLSEWIFE